MMGAFGNVYPPMIFSAILECSLSVGASLSGLDPFPAGGLLTGRRAIIGIAPCGAE
jgi:hypothetical protein